MVVLVLLVVIMMVLGMVLVHGRKSEGDNGGGHNVFS